MSRYDPESVNAAIARATHERNLLMAEMLVDGVVYVTGRLRKAWEGLVGLFSHRPVAGA